MMNQISIGTNRTPEPHLISQSQAEIDDDEPDNDFGVCDKVHAQPHVATVYLRFSYSMLSTPLQW